MWICHVRDFNPKGKNLVIPMLSLLEELYKFQSMPSPKDVFDENVESVFKAGEFTNSEGDTLTVTLKFFLWGIVADTASSTQNSDAFLSDLLNRVSEIFNLVPYEQVIRKRTYLSQLSVSTDRSLELINPKLREISQYLTDNVAGYNNVPFETGGISFWPDQILPVHPSPFSLEREVAMPFSEKRYISNSALQTDKHLELLNKLEVLLGN